MENCFDLKETELTQPAVWGASIEQHGSAVASVGRWRNEVQTGRIVAAAFPWMFVSVVQRTPERRLVAAGRRVGGTLNSWC